MRQFHAGDRGEPVRDIQRRLASLGRPTEPDALGFYGDTTVAAVTEFQRSRGLAHDGIVGPETWQALVDAGYTLGDRMVYRRVPMTRGDDISRLQQGLNSLGFDAGKVDGLFGPATLSAVLDFQHNRSMAEDGIVGGAVVKELALMHRETSKRGKEVVREQAWIASLPHPIAGARIYVDPACPDESSAALTWQAAMGTSATLREAGAMPLLSRSIDTLPEERVRARRANRLDADLVISVTTAAAFEEGAFYFGTDLGSSPAGRVLAEMIGSGLGLPVAARAIPMLRETRAPAVVVATDRLTRTTGEVIAAEIIELFLHGVPQENNAR
ncbi:MAG: N-acetylmuramoyl-L-alanine amidase [Acidimicrobiia bacterium]|nr:MAG: N-acetylmuramoyl-L-alanine amidase [Acidimicrobiia bacterium]